MDNVRMPKNIIVVEDDVDMRVESMEKHLPAEA